MRSIMAQAEQQSREAPATGTETPRKAG
jgi:hypothetical protein